ncbi:MAG: right-handed parallel beta-helix repeat-containing protein [Anaerolineae bacterium]
MNTRLYSLRMIRAVIVVAMSIAMVCGLFFVFGSQSLSAPLATDINSNIISDQTWTAAGNPYVVSGTIQVAAVLTIEQGVVVTFTQDSQLVIQATGSLLATGSGGQPIQFTSPSGACYWKGIVLESDGNTISYASFENASQAIKFEDSNGHTITFNTFQNNGGCVPEPNPLSGAIIGETDNSLINDNVFTSNNTAIHLPRSGGNTIARNVISGTTEHALSFPFNPATGSNDNTIISNTVRHSARFGIYAASGADNSILENLVYLNQQGGIGLEDQTATFGRRLTVSNNDVYSNTGPGLYITGTEALDAGENLIWTNSQGVLWDLNNNPAGYVITRNVVCQNTDFLVKNNDAFTVTAARNWWGTNTPSMGGAGNDIQGQVEIDPRLALTATASVSSLPADGVSTTTLTVSLNGGGETVPARARTVNLATNLGGVSPAVITLDANGQGTTTYTADTTPGPVTVTVGDMCGATPLALNLTVQSTDVGITKTGPGGPVTAGDLITYTIAYSNAPGADATNVLITDTLPAGTGYAGSDEPGFSLGPTAGSVITWARNLLPQGTSGLVTLTLQLDSNAACGSAGDILTNVVEIGTATTESTQANNVFTHTTSSGVLCPAGSLAITKTAQVAQTTPDRDVTYLIEYANNSSQSIDNVIITDTLPLSASYVSDTSGLPTVAGSSVVSWTVGSLGPNQTGVFSLTLHTDPLPVCAGFNLTNTVEIGSGFVAASSADTSVVGVVCGVDLVVTKNDDIGSGGSDISPAVQAGTVYTYTISVVNLGTDTANNVVISETIPVSTSLVGPAGWNLVSGRNYTYSVGSLAPAAGTVVYLQLRADFNLPLITTTVTNEVCASSTEPDAIPGDNCDSVGTDLIGLDTQLSLSKSDGGLVCAVPGQLVDYSIVVTNTGSDPAFGLLLTELLPANTSFQGPANTWTLAGAGVYTHSLGTLNSGGVSNTGFWVQVLSTTVSAITNVVTLEPAGLSFTLTTPISSTAPNLYVIKNDNIELINTATAATIARLEKQLGPLPWLKAVKGGAGAQATSVAPGDTISYTVAYGNAGNSSVAGVVITETLPDNTTFLGPLYWTPVNSNTYVFTVSNLAPGSGGLLDFRVRVNDPFPAGTAGVTNTVRIGNGVLECSVGDNVSVEFTPVNAAGAGTNFAYLPIIMKEAVITTPPTATPTPTATSTPIPGSTPRPPLPTPTPTPLPLAYVSDVAADQETNQVFVASPRHDWVYVIDGNSDTVTRTVAVGNGPTGLAVLTSTTPNKVFVAHQYGANNWHPGVMAFDVDGATAHDTFDTGYAGAAPIKIAANSFNESRVYVSNYFDKLAVLNGNSGPPEARLGWVEQKGFQGAYGIDTSSATHRAYLATRDTGELVIFDGDQDRLLASNYIPTHVKPPQACSLWSVAVNEATGHVFVPCPQLGKVYVLEESQVSMLASVATLEKREGGWALVVAAVDAPWIAEIDVPGGQGLGEEGIAVDTTTGRVYITNAQNDTLVVLQDGSTPVYVSPTVTVGDQPQGVDVNPLTQKVYIGNTGDNTVTVLNAMTPTIVITTISLTP